MRKLFFQLFFLSIAMRGFALLSADSVEVRQSVLAVPSLSYQPETSWAPGVGYGVYFKSRHLSRISSVTGGAAYTFLHQFVFTVTPRLFFDGGRKYLYANLSIKNYPDYYYGISNRPIAVKQAFRSRNLSVLLQPQYKLSDHFLLGFSLAGRYEKVLVDEASKTQQALLMAQYGEEGWSPYSVFSAGGVMSYDSRDNQFYPQRGMFVKMVAGISQRGWASSYSLRDISLDARVYVSLFAEHVVAVQGWLNSVWGPDGVPFQLLPTLGGLDMMRGFQRGMYKGNSAAALQTEYRLPVYGRLKAAFFCSGGDVMSHQYRADKLKVAYGAGLRYRLNDARVHLRLDLARSNYDRQWQYYMTASEAF